MTLVFMCLSSDAVCESLNTVLTNETQLDRLKGCNKIIGSLEISSNVISSNFSFPGTMLCSVLQIYLFGTGRELRQYLGDVQEITGYLFIFRCYGLSSLNVFKHLERIASDPNQLLWQNKCESLIPNAS